MDLHLSSIQRIKLLRHCKYLRKISWSDCPITSWLDLLEGFSLKMPLFEAMLSSILLFRLSDITLTVSSVKEQKYCNLFSKYGWNILRLFPNLKSISMNSTSLNLAFSLFLKAAPSLSNNEHVNIERIYKLRLKDLQSFLRQLPHLKQLRISVEDLNEAKAHQLQQKAHSKFPDVEIQIKRVKKYSPYYVL